MRGTSVWRFLCDDKGYTVSLTLSFLTVTMGAVLLVILLWLATVMEGYQALRNAAAAAAFAGQSQVTAVSPMTGTGFPVMHWGIDAQAAQDQAQNLWQQAVREEHLDGTFTQLQEVTTVQGQRVVVHASGNFQPVFLEKLIALMPALMQQAVISMHVQVTQEWYTPGS